MLTSLAQTRPVAILALSGGDLLIGESVGASGLVTGDVVFHTATAGYQQVLTNPSYRGQLVTMTYPHIGNTGVNKVEQETDQVQAQGLILRNLAPISSSYLATGTLDDYLKRAGTVAIAGVDTRQVVLSLRDVGPQTGAILALAPGETATAQNIERARAAASQAAAVQSGDQSLAQAGTDRAYTWNETSESDTPGAPQAQPGGAARQVTVLDFGVCCSTLRALAARGCTLEVVPASTSAAQVLAAQPNGVVLAGGSGDPAAHDHAIATTRELLASGVPMLGLGLGHQLMALAAGAHTRRRSHCGRGINHPVRNLATGQVTVTGQDQSWTVSGAELPAGVEPTHRSLFDDTLQGLRWPGQPASSFQGVPDPAVRNKSLGDDILGRFVATLQPAER